MFECGVACGGMARGAWPPRGAWQRGSVGIPALTTSTTQHMYDRNDELSVRSPALQGLSLIHI